MAAARKAFGARFGGIWQGRDLSTGTGQPTLFVSVADPTPSDTSATGGWPLIGGRAEVVAAEFTEAQLAAARLRIGQALRNDGRLVGQLVSLGEGNRSNDLSHTGQRVISIYTTTCAPSLLATIGRAAGNPAMVDITKGTYVPPA